MRAEQRQLRGDGMLRVDLQGIRELKIYMTGAEERETAEKCPGVQAESLRELCPP